MSGAARLGDPFGDGDIVAEGSGNVFVNGLPLTYLGAATTGEGCFPPTIISSASGSVFVNNIPVARSGDSKLPHCCPDNGCHSSTVSSASTDVFIG